MFGILVTFSHIILNLIKVEPTNINEKKKKKRKEVLLYSFLFVPVPVIEKAGLQTEGEQSMKLSLGEIGWLLATRWQRGGKQRR